MRQKCFIDLHPRVSKVIGDSVAVARVPIYNCGDKQLGAGCAELLVFKGAVREPALTIGVDGINQNGPVLNQRDWATQGEFQLSRQCRVVDLRRLGNHTLRSRRNALASTLPCCLTPTCSFV